MQDEDHFDQDSGALDDPASVDAPKGRRSFANMRRELSEDELSSSGVQKLLIDDIERLERENSTLSGYRDKFNRADKEAVLLREKEKRSIVADVMFGVCLTMGAAAIGFASSNPTSKPNGWIIVVIGGILIVGGIVSKVIKR